VKIDGDCTGASESPVRWALVALAAAAMAGAAAALVAGTAGMRASFPSPGWPFSPLVPFAEAHLPNAAAWWHYVAGWEALWSVALVGAVLALQRVARARRGRVAAGIIVLQAVLLGLTVSVRMPFNGGQYLYVAYAELVQQGANPYDPPLRSEIVSPQLRAIGTLWGIQTEGNTDPPTRVVMRDRYGPAYTLATAAVLLPFRAADVETQARVIRLWSALAAIGCSILIWRALPAVPWSCAALAAFALNPLVVMQTAMGGHNDVIALLFALGAYGAASRGRFAPAGVAAALSVATKLTFAPFLLPFLVLAWAVRGGRGLFAAAVALGATLVAVGLPFGLARTYVQAPADAKAYNFSYVVSLAYAASRHVPGVHLPASLFSTGYVLLIAAAAGALMLAAARRTRVPPLEAALLLLIFCGSKFLPWYGIALAPLVLVRAPWSIALFLGISLAEQVFGRRDFVGNFDDMPFLTFVALASAVTAAILLAQRLCGGGIPLTKVKPVEPILG
jgi:NAD(P)-dependent dehydrogenase (short-subunit alcohol dehydrogenase family)